METMLDCPEAGSGSAKSMQHRIIVARDRPDLYDDLERRFAGNPLVDVILDRRVGERRWHAVPGRQTRRDADRRQPEEDVQAGLWTSGYLIVRVR